MSAGNEPALSRKETSRIYCNAPVLGGDKQIAIYCHRCRRAYPKDTKRGIWFKEMDKDGNVTDVKWECPSCDSRWSGYDFDDDYDDEEAYLYPGLYEDDDDWWGDEEDEDG